jgi:hypothetical protein
VSDNGTGLSTSLQLDSSLIGSNLAQDGMSSNPEPGQSPSVTSTNNFINFCKLVNQNITNGLQNPAGSCNPVPLGQIPAQSTMPSCKFTNPSNFGTVPAGTTFNVTLAVNFLETGWFANPDTNFMAAPQQLSPQGAIMGHSHIVIEKVQTWSSTDILSPTAFTFFKAMNSPASGVQLTATVTGGVPQGYYRLSSIMTSMNHAPVVGPVAQRGSFEDVVYFRAQ